MFVCESCGHQTPGRTCPECKGLSPSDAKYCCRCGRSLPQERIPGKKFKGDPYDIENRVLCSDGTCIGIINEKGVCCECGKPFEGDASS